MVVEEIQQRIVGEGGIESDRVTVPVWKGDVQRGQGQGQKGQMQGGREGQIEKADSQL